MAEAIVLMDEKTRERFEFPVNPEEITITQGRTFDEIPLIGIDSVLAAGNLIPTQLAWEGFFPRDYDPSLCNYRPEKPATSVRRIEKWLGRVGTSQGKPVPVRAVVTGTFFSRIMVISDFETSMRGGEPGDVYYSITLQSWREQTIRIEDLNTKPKAKTTTPRPGAPTGGRRTHVVKKGDTLQLIALRYYRSTSKWKTIYEANRRVIGSNPNLIKPGQSLVIP